MTDSPLTLEELEQAEAAMNAVLEHGGHYILPKLLVGKLLAAARMEVSCKKKEARIIELETDMADYLREDGKAIAAIRAERDWYKDKYHKPQEAKIDPHIQSALDLEKAQAEIATLRAENKYYLELYKEQHGIDQAEIARLQKRNSSLSQAWGEATRESARLRAALEAIAAPFNVSSHLLTDEELAIYETARAALGGEGECPRCHDSLDPRYHRKDCNPKREQ